MASHIGLIYRDEQAQARIDTALAAIRAIGVEIPDLPRKTRDVKENETLRAEWLADALEAIAVKPAPKPRARKDGDA